LLVERELLLYIFNFRVLVHQEADGDGQHDGQHADDGNQLRCSFPKVYLHLNPYFSIVDKINRFRQKSQSEASLFCIFKIYTAGVAGAFSNTVGHTKLPRRWRVWSRW